MSKHTEVPVDAAKEIATTCAKTMVVILAYDPQSNRTHVTTYGVEPEDKERAAEVGDRCARLICGEGFNDRRTYEDFRFRSEAEWAKERERLLARIAELEGCQKAAEDLNLFAD